MDEVAEDVSPQSRDTESCDGMRLLLNLCNSKADLRRSSRNNSNSTHPLLHDQVTLTTPSLVLLPRDTSFRAFQQSPWRVSALLFPTPPAVVGCNKHTTLGRHHGRLLQRLRR